jgi:hypothetical protein
MALINAKEKEHDTSKLAPDSRDLMESATQKWTKIATNVSKAGFSAHYRGAMACKYNWQTLFANYKKISDYKSTTWNTEDYFHMSNRRRKELTLPPNFCAFHYRELEKFLNQCPCPGLSYRAFGGLLAGGRVGGPVHYALYEPGGVL